MKLGFNDYLAVGVAVVGDIIDLSLAAVPYLGELVDVPTDIAVPLINSYLTKRALPMAGLVELGSVLIPGDLLDYLPIHTIAIWWTLRQKKKEK